MGCEQCKNTPCTRPVPEERIQLTERQKHLVRETWTILQEDIAHVGVVTFMGLFEKDPDIQSLFIPLRGKTFEEMEHSDRLRHHGMHVMFAVGKVVARLDEPRNIEIFLCDLGNRHSAYNMKVAYFDLIGPQFIQAIKPTFKDNWTIETEVAWSDLFKMITSVLKRNCLEKS